MKQSEAKLNKMNKDYMNAMVLEKDFRIACRLNGFTIEESTKEQDSLEGWDGRFISIPENYNQLKILENKYYDYKGIKGDETNTIEFVASYKSGGQKLGWLFRGKSEVLIFLLVDGKTHIFVEKEVLKNFMFTKVPILKELYDAGDEKYFLSRIQGSWGRFTFVDKFEDAFENKVYSRAKFGTRDLITKITTDDLINLSFLKVNIDDYTISIL